MLSGDLFRADQGATAGVSRATDLAAGAAGNAEATLAGATRTRCGVGHGDAAVVLARLATAARECSKNYRGEKAKKWAQSTFQLNHIEGRQLSIVSHLSPVLHDATFFTLESYRKAS